MSDIKVPIGIPKRMILDLETGFVYNTKNKKIGYVGEFTATRSHNARWAFGGLTGPPFLLPQVGFVDDVYTLSLDVARFKTEK